MHDISDINVQELYGDFTYFVVVLNGNGIGSKARNTVVVEGFDGLAAFEVLLLANDRVRRQMAIKVVFVSRVWFCCGVCGL